MKDWIKQYIWQFLFVILSFGLVVGLNILITARREQMKNQQQKLNFACVPGVYIESFSNKNNDFAICLMEPDSKEFVVREIAK